MADITLQKYNFYNYLGAVNIRLNTEMPVPINYIAELSTSSTVNIYLTNNGFNYFLIPEDEYENIYMNDNISGLARGMTALKHTDFLRSSYFKYTYVNNMHTSYMNCFKLQGSPLCGNKVKSMYGAYFNDSNLSGNYAIGKSVNNLIGSYYNCQNLTNFIITNTNAVMMGDAFYNCVNLTGVPFDADRTKSLLNTFYNCYLLNGKPSNCNNAFITTNAYYNCPNLYGTFYWLYNKASQADVMNSTNMFYGRNYSNKLNIYVYNQRAVLNALVNYSDSYGNIYGSTAPLEWTKMQDTEGFDYYNNALTNTNIYIIEDLSKYIEFNFTGTIQTFVVPTTGIYQLETWGAQGGSAHNSTTTTNGGFGAYSTGQVRLNRGDVLYIVVGGQNGYGGGGSVGR